MEIILLERVSKLGTVGDIVKVKPGYARNYLIPTKKALRATEENKKIFEQRKLEIEAENQHKTAQANKIKEQINDRFFVLIRQASEDGRLFGSITSRDIVEAINFDNTSNEVKRSQVLLNSSIKYIGVHIVQIQLHSEVICNICLNVARSTDEAKENEKKYLNPTEHKVEQA